jgi:hypothetical protein
MRAGRRTAAEVLQGFGGGSQNAGPKAEGHEDSREQQDVRIAPIHSGFRLTRTAIE